MPAASDNRIPTVTAVQLPKRDGNTRVLPHLSAPALAPKCIWVAPSNGHMRYYCHMTWTPNWLLYTVFLNNV